MQEEERSRLYRLATLFSKLGVIAFGGPAAHIAMMHEEVVKKKKWLSEQHFLDLVGATNLIPGPNSTEMAIHIGRERAGWKGLIVAGCCFILPAVIITAFLAWLYKRYGQLPQVYDFIYGIKPAIIAIILAAVFPLAKKSFKTAVLVIIGLVALILSLLGFNELYILFGAGLFYLALAATRSKKINTTANGMMPFVLLQAAGPSILSVSNLHLFFIFLKIGAVLYGSGYVLFAFLDTELVAKGIITRQQLADAIAVGQFTPGPVFSAVTFIGFQVNDLPGAAIATIGVFLPSFIFVALLNPIVKRLRQSTLFSAFLDAVNVASVSLIIAVCYKMGRETILDWRTVLIAVISLVLLFFFRKLNSAFVVIGSSLLGYLLTWF